MFSNSGCVQSPNGTVDELVATKPPTLDGAARRSYTAPSGVFVLNGECDAALVLQYSFDAQNWVVTPNGCPLGRFALTLTLPGVLTEVYLRSVRTGGFTASAHASIRLVRPPTSDSFHLVSSGAADQDGHSGTQNALESTFSMEAMSNGLANLKTSLIDVIYGN